MKRQRQVGNCVEDKTCCPPFGLNGGECNEGKREVNQQHEKISEKSNMGNTTKPHKIPLSTLICLKIQLHAATLVKTFEHKLLASNTTFEKTVLASCHCNSSQLIYLATLGKFLFFHIH